MKLHITILPGDGVGPEVTGEAVRVLRTVLDLYGYDASFEEHPIGGVAIRQFGVPLTHGMFGNVRATDSPISSCACARYQRRNNSRT